MTIIFNGKVALNVGYPSRLPTDNSISQKEIEFLKDVNGIISVRCGVCNKVNHEFPRKTCCNKLVN